MIIDDLNIEAIIAISKLSDLYEDLNG